MNTDRIETLRDDEDAYTAEEMQYHDDLAERAKKTADKILKKNKREIDRLKKHGQMCLVSGNRDGYIYAINKLRGIYRQTPVDKQTGDTLYETSRQQLIELIRESAQ